MKDKQTTLNSIASALGTVMMISWTLFLSPVGALLLLGVGYAIVLDKFWLGVPSGLILLMPLAITLAWAPFGLLAALGERSTSKVKVCLRDSGGKYVCFYGEPVSETTGSWRK
jgi:hypothetical protein